MLVVEQSLNHFYRNGLVVTLGQLTYCIVGSLNIFGILGFGKPRPTEQKVGLSKVTMFN